jgi:hypothetical protein
MSETTDTTTEQTNSVETASTETTTQSTESTGPAIKSLDDLKAASTKQPTTPAATKKEATAVTKPTTPAWTPNWKFKAFDKEHEVEEWVRPLVKDAETEEKIKKLHSKAYAMDGMKEKLEKQRGEFETYKSTVTPKLKTYDFLDVILKNGDFDTFFDRIGVKDEVLFDWFEKKLEMLQASPTQKAEYQKQMALKQQSYSQATQLEELQQAHAEQIYQTRMMQLDSTLMRPDVSQYAQAWDQRKGQIGAFRKLVIDQAAAVYSQTNGVKDLSAEEAVDYVIQNFGVILGLQQQAQTPQVAMNTPQTTVVTPPTAPVIPTIASRGTSPVKKVPKSLDDLKKLAAELSAQ